MKYLLILLLFSSCFDDNRDKERKCKRIDTNTVEYLWLNKNYSVGDTLMHLNSANTESKYVIIPETLKIK